MPGQVVDYLPEEQLGEIRNLEEFAGMLCLDKWTANANGRQAVFSRKAREKRYSACFIDQGYCFHAGEWRFEDAPLRGVYPRNTVYANVAGWGSFEPWLTRMETMEPAMCGGRRKRFRRSGTAAIWQSWRRWWRSCWNGEDGSGSWWRSSDGRGGSHFQNGWGWGKEWDCGGGRGGKGISMVECGACRASPAGHTSHWLSRWYGFFAA
jgi:hypothetical protein